MERLTKLIDGEAVLRECNGPCKTCGGVLCGDVSKVFERLAAYEDTGLSPETVSDLLDSFTYFYRTVEGLDIVDHVHFGAFVDRVKCWAQAEKDGRLVVLGEPRKPLVWGDDSHNTILCPNCNHDLMGGFPEDEYCEKDMYQCPYCGQSIDSAKTITREEAEAALEKREADDEID